MSFTPPPLLELTPAGLYCKAADTYLDPWKPVPKALITHGHSDHAKWGMGAYICTTESLPILKHRLGSEIEATGYPYNVPFSVRGVTFSFHPAGHVPGSAQIRVEYRGEVWVFSGDYKVENDGVSTPFEAIECHTFISECTFGLPVFRWRPQSEVITDIETWITTNSHDSRSSVLFAYSLGKAQRILAHLPHSIGEVYLHPSIRSMCKVIGIPLNHLSIVDTYPKKPPYVIIAPPGTWSSQNRRNSDGVLIPSHSLTASLSGWMSVRGLRKRSDVDRGFPLSDHADFLGLIAAIQATKAEKILLTHGFCAPFGRYLRERGYQASELSTPFSSEDNADGESTDGRIEDLNVPEGFHD